MTFQWSSQWASHFNSTSMFKIQSSKKNFILYIFLFVPSMLSESNLARDANLLFHFPLIFHWCCPFYIGFVLCSSSHSQTLSAPNRSTGKTKEQIIFLSLLMKSVALCVPQKCLSAFRKGSYLHPSICFYISSTLLCYSFSAKKQVNPPSSFSRRIEM